MLKLDLSKLSQSKGSIGRPLGFVIDRLNTSASLYRIAPCLSGGPWAMIVKIHHVSSVVFSPTAALLPQGHCLKKFLRSPQKFKA